MVELVHHKRQIHSVHAGVISPSFPQAMGAVISSQPNIMADRGDELPGLTSLDGFGVAIRLGVEKNEVFGILRNAMVSFQIPIDCLPNAPVDDNFMWLVAFLLFDPKPLGVRIAPRTAGAQGSHRWSGLRRYRAHGRPDTIAAPGIPQP